MRSGACFWVYVIGCFLSLLVESLVCSLVFVLLMIGGFGQICYFRVAARILKVMLAR